MEETSAPSMDMLSAPPTDVSSVAPSMGYTYTDPISSFFGGIFGIIILILFIVLIVIMLIGKAFGLVKDAPPPPPPAKEKFKDGPPYPHCPTNGALGLF